MGFTQVTTALFGAAYGLSVFLSRAAPEHLIWSSVYYTSFSIFGILFLCVRIWNIIIFPLYLSPLKGIPTPPGANLVFGHFPQLFKDPSGVPQQRWIEEVPNEGLLRYFFAFNVERVFPTTPKALAEVLVTKNYDFIKPPQMKQGIGQLLGIGILLAEGDEHRRQRRLMMPAFAFRHVKDLYPVFWGKAKESVRAISAAIENPPTDGSPSSVEVGEWASRTTLDIIGVAGMGQDFGAIDNPDNDLNKTYRSVFQPNQAARILGLASLFLPRWFLSNLPLKANYDTQNARIKIRETCASLIKSKREKMEKSARSDVDILSVLIESGGFSDEDIINQLMTFLAAGHETTASSMIWAIYLLCKHPEAQKRLREEIHQGLPSAFNPDATISSTDIDRLPYLSAVCNEALRLMPPVALTLRVAAQDTTILGNPIPKGTTVVLVPQAVNLNKSLWGEDADKFNPDRWMAPGKANSGGAESNYSFLTFLHGPRSCIGQAFAKAEFACLLAAWVGSWEMELTDPNFQLEIVGGITSKPKGGLLVNLTRAEGW